MNIKITSDSTCDLSQEILQKHNIDVLPLYIVIDGVAHRDGIDIKKEDIFNYVDNEFAKTGVMPKSAAINVEDYIGYFTPLSKEYDAVIHVNISSDFSSCYQNACMAAKEFNNVYVVDSRNLSSGQGHVVLNAALMAEQGLAPQEIVDKLNDLTKRVEASFVIDRMDYLQKGGRCSSLLAIAAKVARIKPSINVIDGKMAVGKKYMGTFTFALKKYVEDRLKDRDDIMTDRIFITHPVCSPEIVDMVREEIKKYADFDEIIETNAGSTISTHCGPYTLGILFIRK